MKRISIIIIAVCGLLAVAWATHFSIPLTGDKMTVISGKINLFAVAAPISHWKMNDNAANTVVIDSVGTNNGVLTGAGNTSASSVPGKINTALTFDGTNDLVNCGTSADLDPGTNDFSVSMWVYAPRYVENGGLLQKGGGAGIAQFYFRQNDGLGTLRFTTYDGSAPSTSVQSPTGYLPISNWTHLVVARIETTVYIYKNGTSISATGAVANISNPTVPFNINSGPSDGYSGGFIDDVRFYNRGLSSSEINAIYNGGNGTEL